LGALLKPILLATDDSNAVIMFWRYHKQCRIENPLEVVSDGEDVVRYMESNRLNLPLPVLLVLGLEMPRMGGFQVLKHFGDTCRRGFSTVLMIESHQHDLPLVAAAYELGVESFLMKPLEKKEFCSLMSRFHGVKMDGCAVDVSPSQLKPL
jgi:PleD family two-component response regulator